MSYNFVTWLLLAFALLPILQLYSRSLCLYKGKNEIENLRLNSTEEIGNCSYLTTKRKIICIFFENHYNNLLEQWKVRTIFETYYLQQQVIKKKAIY